MATLPIRVMMGPRHYLKVALLIASLCLTATETDNINTTFSSGRYLKNTIEFHVCVCPPFTLAVLLAISFIPSKVSVKGLKTAMFARPLKTQPQLIVLIESSARFKMFN